MRRLAISAAIGIVVVHLILRVVGAGEHTSVLTGMPQSSASWALGPLHVLFTLLAMTAAPICSIAVAIDTALRRLRRSSVKSGPLQASRTR